MPSFSADIERFVQKTGLKADTVLRKLALDGLHGVIMKTPVDTGRARASWRIGINKVDTSVEPERDKASSTPAGSPPGAGEADPGVLQSANFGDTITISNSLPYIKALEDGYSKQAPNGMLALTFEELKAGLERAIAAAG